MKRLWKCLGSHWVIGFGLLGFSLAHYISDEPLIETLRLKTFDFYQQIHPRDPKAHPMMAETLIVDIDDASLTEIGQWPWPRDVLATLTSRLMQMGAGVVGYDIVFAEKDRTSPDAVLTQLSGLSGPARSEIAALPSHEALMANSIQQGRVVLGQAGMHSVTPLSDLSRKVGFGFMGPDPTPYLRQYRGLVRNLPELEKAAQGIGLFSTMPDADGMYRRVALMERVGAQVYPSLSLEMLRVALGGQDDYLIKSDTLGGIQKIIVKTADPTQSFTIPTDPHGRVWVHYARYTTDDAIYLSAKDVLSNDPAVQKRTQQRVQGKLAILGTSAVGLKDIRPTPINGALPGVEVHLQLLQTILSDSHLTRPFMARGIEFGVILVGGILMIVLARRIRAIPLFLLGSLIIGGLAATAWHLYTTQRILVDVSYPWLSISTIFITLSYLNYIREEKERRQVRDAFSHYVSPALLDQLAANPEKLKLGGETRDLTILFSDIRGFTTISEQYDAEGLTRFINQFLTPMTDVLLANRATIDKYMGDAIMAFWNAPLDDPDHAIHACEGAIAMFDAVVALNNELETQAKAENRKHTPVAIGVGINSGPCCVGNMGSRQRFDYSALGDDVNLASRLEGQSKTYGMDIILGPRTYEAVKDRFATLELDLIQVKGKTEPVYVYALLGQDAMRQEAWYTELQTVNAAFLTAYRHQAWDEAETLNRQRLALSPRMAGLCELYAERIAEYRDHPPGEGWNGAYVAKSK
jgi:adenylate cyclase